MDSEKKAEGGSSENNSKFKRITQNFFSKGHIQTFKLSSCYCCIKSNVLLLFIIAGVVLGIILGVALKSSNKKFTDQEIIYLSFPGIIFLNLLKMMIIPLIISSLIAGLTGLGSKVSGALGWRTLLYYMSTTLIAVILGIILVSAIRPGTGGEIDTLARSGESKDVDAADSFTDLLRNLFPPNLIQACIEKYQTTKTVTNTVEVINITSNISTETIITVTKSGNYVDGMNILGLVMFSIVFGIIVNTMGEEGVPLINFFTAANIAIIQMVGYIIWLTPIGVMFLICGRIVGMDDWSVVIGKLGLYMMTVIIGLVIHGFIFLPLLYFIITRNNPFLFIKGLGPCLFTAFGTASSSATLPVTIRCLEDNNGVDYRISRFILPIGATINMDGTALYEAVAAIFIAQLNGYSLDFGQIIAVCITSTLASIGAAGIPEAGLVTMVIVLTAVGLPIDDITLIIPIDWFLDRCRTTINVLGDSIGSGIIYHKMKHTLSEEIDGPLMEYNHVNNKAAINDRLDYETNFNQKPQQTLV